MARLLRHYFGLNSLWVLLLLNACQQPDSIPQNDRDYAPLATGKYWVYEVHEDRYSLSEAPTSSTYFVKETIGELLSTGSGYKNAQINSVQTKSVNGQLEGRFNLDHSATAG